jgi:hypothetical protein
MVAIHGEQEALVLRLTRDGVMFTPNEWNEYTSAREPADGDA